MAQYTIQTKTCERCGATFSKAPTCSEKEWNMRRGCSRSCASVLRGNIWLKQHMFKTGSTVGAKTRFKKGNTAHNFKGDDASYTAKHIWIRYHFGKASICENEFCTGKSKNYHWSNISGEYKRERNDWQQLCVSCHKKYDLNRIGDPTDSVVRTTRTLRGRSHQVT